MCFPLFIFKITWWLALEWDPPRVLAQGTGRHMVSRSPVRSSASAAGTLGRGRVGSHAMNEEVPVWTLFLEVWA